MGSATVRKDNPSCDDHEQWELDGSEDSRFRRLVEGISDYAIYMLDADGLIRSWNKGAESLEGYAKREVLGRHVSLFYPADAVHAGVPEMQLRSAAKHGNFETEEWRIRKNGKHFWAYVAISALYDALGNLEGFAKVTRDMTERKRLEERFRRVVESAPNAMVMVNATGRIEMVNVQAEKMFAYARDEMLGNPLEMLVPERFRSRHPDLRMHFFSQPQSRPMGAGRDLYARRKDGSEFPVEIGLNPIETDEGVMVLSSIVDISERKRLEERFRRVVESAPNAMVMANARGRIEMVNTQSERLFGYSRAEMLGNPVELLVPDRFRSGHPGKRESFFHDPRSRPMGAGRDLFGRRKDGSEFPIEIGLNPIETEEGVMVLSAIVDISDRKQKEQRIQAALEEKDLLLGEIHHRVKNNLQIVQSLLDLQSTRISDPAVLDMLTDSQNRVRSMALIHQTLYQSKDFANVDFGGFLEALAPTLIASYGVNAENIHLDINVDEVSLPINSAIPCGLLINELITNALKHAFPSGEPGKVMIRVSKRGADAVLVEVSDDGVGISDALDIERSETLGLSLVTMLSRQLNGNLSIHRQKPTRFALEFPITAK